MLFIKVMVCGARNFILLQPSQKMTKKTAFAVRDLRIPKNAIFLDTRWRSRGGQFLLKIKFSYNANFFRRKSRGPKNPPPKSVDPTLETPSTPRLCTAFSQNRSHELYRKSTKSHIIFPHHPPENMWIWAK